MKLSSQAIVLCTVLVATTTVDVVNASDRKLIRNNRKNNNSKNRNDNNSRTERKRNLFKVEAQSKFSSSSLEEIVQIDDVELVRALMGTGGVMSMSMSMPSKPIDGGDSTPTASGTGNPNAPPAESPPVATVTATPSDPSPSTDSSSTSSPPVMAPPTPTSSLPVMTPPTPTPGGEIPAPEPLDAPTGGDPTPTTTTVEPEDDDSSASRRSVNVAVATVVTTAMVVSFIL